MTMMVVMMISMTLVMTGCLGKYIVANLCQGPNVGQKGVRPQFGLITHVDWLCATSCVLLCFIIYHCFVCYCYNI